MNLPEIDICYAEGAIECNLDIEEIATRSIKIAIELSNIHPKPNSELSILIAGDPELQKLNSKWRGKDKPTNVLSFPGDEERVMLGDIAVSLETAMREAELENKSLHDHLSHLFVHGFLHLFGYDHETENEARIMEGLETKIMSELGIADPYQNGQQA